MPSKQEPSSYIQETSLPQENVLDRMCVPASAVAVEKSTSQPVTSDILSYRLKNLKIELPRVNIPDEVIFKHEIETYMNLFQCKEKPVRTSLMQVDRNGSSLPCSEIYIPPGLHYEEGQKTSAKILNFSCTKCQNNIRYSPNDLQKHFQLLHHGELPSYPCEMCNFSANNFQSFNQHRRTHRSTLVKCEICNDDQRYTLLDLTKHFTSKHCANGHFQCERCIFSTRDVGTFVQHIHRHNEIQYKCDKCHHVSFSKEEFQKHIVSHAGAFPFSCQYCNYMASRKNYLLKHIITLHRDHLYAKDNIDADNNEKRMKTSTGLKLILKRYKTGASRKALWRRKRITSGGCRTRDEDRQVLKNVKEIHPESEELGQSAKEPPLNEVNTLANEKHMYSGVKSSAAVQYKRTEDGLGSGLGLLKKAVHGPTVLMVKNNKISVPANYSAKFMGFKVVDGKQHIVIKLLPNEKQNLPAGNKVEGVKDSSTGCLPQSVDNLSFASSVGPHEINQQMSRNNSVPLLTSPPSVFCSQYSGKIKQESTSSLNWNASQTVASSDLVVGKCATRLPVKPDSLVPCDLVEKSESRHPISWKNCIPQDHSQVSTSAGTHMLHYDPMKKTFSSELKVLNGEVNNSSKHNNFYCSSADVSNHAPLPFHNYSKMSILDKYTDFVANKTFPQQSRSASASTSCVSQSATGLNLEKRSLQSLYGVNTNNAPVFSTNEPNYAIERQHCGENHECQQYLNTKVNQVLNHVAEKCKQENASNCVNSSVMPKITSVFSLQGNQASSYLSPEVNQSLQDVLKGQSVIQPYDYIKAGYSSNNQMDPKTHFKDSAVVYSLTHSPAKFKRELNVNCNTTNEDMTFRNEGQVAVTSLRTEEINPASRTASIGTLHKTQTDSIIMHQLAKEKMHYSIRGTNIIRSSLSEQKKSVLLQPSAPKFFVPLRLAHQQGMQVISGTSSSKMGSDPRGSRGTTTSLLLNKGPGMILTFGSGSLGTIANATETNSQVLEKFAPKECSKEAVSSLDMKLKIDNFKSVRNSDSVSKCSGAADVSYAGQPQKEQLSIINSDSRISSLKILAGYQGGKVASLESVKQPEIGKEPVYALLPDGRQAVFLKCMSSKKSLIQNHSVPHDTANSQNTEPKKPGVMQQKLFLKIKTFPAVDNCPSVSNFVSSLKFNNMHSLNSPVPDLKQTTLSSTTDALLLPHRLMPANASLARDESKDPCTSVESVHSSRHAKIWSKKILSDSAQTVPANKRSSFGSQMPGTVINKFSKVRRHSKETDAKVSDATVSQKNQNLKRRAREDLQEPPRKKTLHRKCKEKNQMDVNEFESLLHAPCKPRASKDTERILRLLPFNSKQLVKCPRRNQPVVVLNHPDADVPEVVNVMKTIAKFKGHVLKVSLSKRTIDALLEPGYYNNSLYIITNDLSRRKRRMLKPVSPVKERFVLKLTLKKTSKNNYQIVKTTSDNTLKMKFSCWFCGRIFDNQDNWVGHGQRHLMEATRDWNSL